MLWTVEIQVNSDSRSCKISSKTQPLEKVKKAPSEPIPDPKPPCPKLKDTRPNRHDTRKEAWKTRALHAYMPVDIKIHLVNIIRTPVPE